MAGMEAIGGATQVTVQETKAKAVGQAVQAAAEKAGKQAVGIPADKYHGGKVTGAIGCPLPPPITFRQDPREEARKLVIPVLKSSGADQLEAYQKFTEKVNYVSTATLKEALKLLDEEEKGLNPFVNRGRLRVIQLLRNNIQAELKTRPKEPKEEASELIDSVADKMGTEQLEAFVKFADEVKGASRSTLEAMRDQLIDRMANESDREQRLIYKLMLHTVNQELDGRGGVLRLRDFVPQPWPQPVPIQFNAEERRLLGAKLSAVGAETQNAVRAIVGIKD